MYDAIMQHKGTMNIVTLNVGGLLSPLLLSS